MNFVAVATVETTAFVGGIAARYEITNLCGTVIAHTTTASDANRRGAIEHARKHMGDCYAIDTNGNRVGHVAHF